MLKIKESENAELVAEIREKLEQNDGYCPCRVVKNADTKCMCKEFRDKFARKERGECHCGIYEIVEAE